MPGIPQLIPMPNTDSVQIGAPGEEIKWTQSFTYLCDVAKRPDQVYADALIPKQGSRMQPPAGWSGPNPSVTVFNEYVCRSVDISPVPQSPTAWLVRVTWSTRKSKDAQRPYFKITRSTAFRTVGMYRTGSAILDPNQTGGLPADGSAPFPPQAWMGGTKVDTNGTPMQARIAQQSIQVDTLWDRTKDRTTDVMQGAVLDVDPPSEYSSVYCNTRNHARFLGWPIGYVTYLGWTANQAPDEWLVVSHRFLADDWQHAEQRVAPNTGGKMLLAAGPTWGANPSIPTQSAAYVAWYQPFPNLTNFTNIMGWRANMTSALTVPQPVQLTP